MCVCVCVKKGASLENPIKGDMYWFSVLFKAFWNISADVSFNVRANGRKQTNLLLSSPLPHFTYFLSSLSLRINLCLTRLLLSISPRNCKNQNCPKIHSLCPLLLAVIKSKLVHREPFCVCFISGYKSNTPDLKDSSPLNDKMPRTVPYPEGSERIMIRSTMPLQTGVLNLE